MQRNENAQMTLEDAADVFLPDKGMESVFAVTLEWAKRIAAVRWPEEVD